MLSRGPGRNRPRGADDIERCGGLPSRSPSAVRGARWPCRCTASSSVRIGRWAASIWSAAGTRRSDRAQSSSFTDPRPLKERSQCVAELRVTRRSRTGPCDQQQIPSGPHGLELFSEQLAQPAPHPIPLYRSAEPAWRAQPDARLRPFGPQRSQDQESVRTRRPVASKRIEIRLAPKHREGRHGCARRRQTVSFSRPLARRLASTRRPPFEAMRARKPCSRFRARFLGW